MSTQVPTVAKEVSLSHACDGFITFADPKGANTFDRYLRERFELNGVLSHRGWLTAAAGPTLAVTQMLLYTHVAPGSAHA